MKKIIFLFFVVLLSFYYQNSYSKVKEKGKITCNFAYQLGTDWTLVYCETCSNVRAANRNQRQSTCN